VGLGLTPREFKSALLNQTITGHIGLEQSIAIVSDALNWKLDRISVENLEPMLSKRPLRRKGFILEAGRISGVRQSAVGILHGKPVIELNFAAYAGSEEFDEVHIGGLPSINLRISPCINGDIGTVGMLTNCVKRVVNAPTGLLTMKDLPIPFAGSSRSELSIDDNRSPR
jgi:4-hydroxy-tetrahydrodipicolinate reductase